MLRLTFWYSQVFGSNELERGSSAAPSTSSSDVSDIFALRRQRRAQKDLTQPIPDMQVQARIELDQRELPRNERVGPGQVSCNERIDLDQQGVPRNERIGERFPRQEVQHIGEGFLRQEVPRNECVGGGFLRGDRDSAGTDLFHQELPPNNPVRAAYCRLGMRRNPILGTQIPRQEIPGRNSVGTEFSHTEFSREELQGQLDALMSPLTDEDGDLYHTSPAPCPSTSTSRQAPTASPFIPLIPPLSETVASSQMELNKASTARRPAANRATTRATNGAKADNGGSAATNKAKAVKKKK